MQVFFLCLKRMLALVLFLIILSPFKSALGNNERPQRKLDSEISGFISIDCGCPDDYNDPKLGIPYKTDRDSGIIDTGELYSIAQPYQEDCDRRGKHLRSFRHGKRNCYTLNIKEGRNNKYLIRATFMYGNYDYLDILPEFDLHLGTDYWITVKLSNSSAYIYHEVIHVLSTDNVDVCLVNTDNGVPIISALELRPLDNNIYQSQHGSLVLYHRLDYGQSNRATRYPDDTYDRIWGPYSNPEDSDWVAIQTPSFTSNKVYNRTYKIPDSVLRTAVRTSNSSSILTIVFKPNVTTTTRWFFYFHFAEIEKEPREVQITLNPEFLTTVKLEYMQPISITSAEPISGQRITASIEAIDNSSLPPILNALEIYEVKELSGIYTALEDVNAIKEIKELYKVTRDSWQGDPCAPKEFRWEGVACTDDNTPRISSLNLSSSTLTDIISESFGKLKALEFLDLSNNKLSGPVPPSLAYLPKLRYLILDGNKLSGPIPEDLLAKKDNGSLFLSLSITAPEHRRKSFTVPAVSIGTILAFLVLLAGIAVVWRIQRKKKRVVTKMSTKKRQLVSKTKPFSYSEVLEMTDSLNTPIGEGGFGKVYRGVLDDGTQVAVKLLSPSSKQGYNEFQAEAQLLLRVHHRNLVSLVGYCDDDENKALIYEYMANGNLQQHLSVSNPNVMDWRTRLQIAVNAAQGLEYLHNGCKPAIVHRDLKPPNILLDNNMQAKIGDFGLSRVFKVDNESQVSTKLAGTIGYLDPEYQVSGYLNTKSDVYSFGIILFQLITGHPAIIRCSSHNINIIEWVRQIVERGDIESIVDERLQGGFNHNSAWRAVEIATSCVPPTAIQRPDMSQVLAELKECWDIEMKTPGKSSIQVSIKSGSLSSVSAR